jgi:hypothetical protein
LPQCSGTKAKPDVDVRQRIPLDEAADPDRYGAVAELCQVQAVAQAGVHVERTPGEVSARVLERAHALVADELEPRRLVDEAQDERCIVEGKAAKQKPLGGEDRHRGAAPDRVLRSRWVKASRT